MRAHIRMYWILVGVTLSLALPSLGSVFSATFFPKARFAHLPIHSLLEASGGLMAIAIAGILIVERPRKQDSSHYPWMAGALAGMGVLDLFHSAVMPGNNFVWLHSTATFVGGGLFALVWCGPRGLPGRTANRFPWFVLALTTAFGTASCVFAEQIPTMAIDGNFTYLARGLNIGGGLGFLLAGVFFVRRFHRHQNHEDWLFAVHTLLFGIAGILFELSALWDAAWWWWHVLRLAAYLAALAFAISAYLNAEHEVIIMNRRLNSLNRSLDKRVADRTEELSHERFLLYTLLDHLPDAIFFKDTEGRFTRVSRSLANKLGCEPEEMIDKSDKDFFPEAYAAEARADEEKLLHSGQSLIGKEEKPHWISDAETWVSTTKVPLPDAEGRIIGTFGISHDITTQKQAEKNFRGVIDAAPNPLVVVDEQGCIELVNAATKSLFGYEQDDLVKQPIEILVPVRFREGHVQKRQEFMQQPRSRVMGADVQLLGRRKDGSEFPIEVRLNLVRLNERNALLACVYDLTARKQVEHALVAAKQAAEAANRAKSDFLANMSHEIRTPMNAIMGMTDLLLDTSLDRTQRDYLTLVSDSASSLLSIINQILDFSKIEAGKLELESLDFDLRDVVGDTLKSLGIRAHSKQLELAWHVHANVPNWLRGDSGRLRQMLVNLVGNAIKFTESGEVAVDIESQDCGTEQMVLHVAVRDTGEGIPREKQSLIFSAFEQADNSTTREFGGTGLGLAITSRLAEAMGGRAWVESEPGVGSVFHFTANLHVTTAPVDVEIPDLNGLSVLVVDDNETNRRILEEMLQSWGMSAQTVDSGHAALELLQKSVATRQTLPLIVTDVNMPEMDGFALVEQMRSQPALRDAVIIMLTSGGRHGDLRRCKELGVVAHLMKPVKQSELLEAITRSPRPRPNSKQVADNPVDDAEPSKQPKHRILLAEDGKANQIVARGMLTKLGHTVTIAENGKEAIQMWLDGSYDLILMDVQMPILDGLEATQRIRKMERETGHHTPIVAVTARAMKGDCERCLAAGMDHYVSKPIRRTELKLVLEKISANLS